MLLVAGAVCWMAGNFLWVTGQAIPFVVPWWVGFLVVTIGGERLELSRLRRPSKSSRALFSAIMVLLAFLIAMNAIAIVLRKKFERRW